MPDCPAKLTATPITNTDPKNIATAPAAVPVSIPSTPRAVLRVNIPFVPRELPFIPGHSLVGDRAARECYLNALEREAAAVAPEATGLRLGAIELVGPMPSMMSPDHIGRLTGLLQRLFSCEPGAPISIVAAPHTIGVPALTGWGQGGINRVELLADSLEPTELTMLGRPFDSGDVQNALLFLDKFHLNNVSVRIIYGIPGQNGPSLMRTLRSLAGVDVPHLTLVSFAELRRNSAASDEDIDATAESEASFERELMAQARERLSLYGYDEYLPGCFAIHERFRDQAALLRGAGCSEIGLGLDAISRFGDIAYRNTGDFATYAEAADDPSRTVVAVEAL